MGKIVKMSFEGKNLRKKNEQMCCRFMILKSFWTLGAGLPPPWGDIHVYYHNIHETAWPIKAKLHVEHRYERGMKVYINGPGHLTKMATMDINSKNLYTRKSSSPEPEAYDFDTWHEASERGALQSLYKS